MFNNYHWCREGGQIADYRLDFVMKQKSINFYVKDVPMILSEALKFNELTGKTPRGLPYGVRARVWSDFFPEFPFPGETVSYSVYNELGEAVEIMTAYEAFDMNTVPWDDVIA